MKTVLKNYAFNAAARTITLTDVTTVRLERLALITDTTTNKILYNFADGTVTYATVATNVITLATLQGGEANGDKLRIDYDTDIADTAFGDSTNATQIKSSVLPTRAATSANQTAEISSLVTIATNTGLDATAANQTNKTQMSRLTDGTNEANVLKSDGTAAGQNAALTAGTAYTPSTYALTSTTPNTPWIDMANYAWLAVTSSITAGGLTYQTSNDAAQTSVFPIYLYTPNSSGGGVSQNFSSAPVLVHGARAGRWFRVSSGLTGANTASVTVTLFSNPSSYPSLNTSQQNLALNNAGLSPALAQVGVSDGSNARLLAGDSNGNLKALHTDGTNIANVLKSDGTSTGQNSQLVAGSIQPTFQVTLNATTPNSVWYDIGNYASMAVSIVSHSGVAQFTFKTSNDTSQATSVNQTMLQQDNGSFTQAPYNSQGDGTVYISNRTGRYLRFTSSYTSTTAVVLSVTLFTFPITSSTTQIVPATVTGAGVPGTVYPVAMNGDGNLRNLAAVNAVGVSGGSTTSTLAVGNYVYNGSTADVMRSSLGAPVGTLATATLASSTNGYTPNKLITAATTNATNIKSSAGTVGYISAGNTTSAPLFLKIYDKATAPIVGTDVPVHTFIIPGGTSGVHTNMPLPPQGIACLNGISIAITGAAADVDTTATTTGAAIINYGTK